MSVAEQDAFTEQVEAGTPVHLPFEHLDAVDVAFDRTGTVGQGQAVADRIVISLQASDEAVQMR